MSNAPYMYWVGADLPAGTTAAEIDQFNDYYTQTHLPEVLSSNPGFTTGGRYQLLRQDPRGDFGPEYLAIYEMDGQAAADGYIARNDGPASGRPQYTPGPPVWNDLDFRWRLLWNRITPTEGDLGRPEYIFLVGMNVPAGTTDAELAEFNEFYTNIHVPEVVAASGFRCGMRYELYREFSHPAPGSPQFLAVYDADETSIERLHERQANPQGSAQTQLSSGPPVWEAHDTLWRLEYRRID